MARSDFPVIGNPNTSKEERNAQGDLIRRRYYGSDGHAILNIDYDHDHGAGKPHAHDWDWLQDEPRSAGRPLKLNEH